MEISEPITTTCRNCKRIYVWATIFELAEYCDAFPENSASPCCDDAGGYLEVELIEFVNSNLQRFLIKREDDWP